MTRVFIGGSRRITRLEAELRSHRDGQLPPEHPRSAARPHGDGGVLLLHQCEKAEIAKKYLIPRQLEENGLAGKAVVFADDAVASIVSNYTRESGVRQLERQVGAVCRKVARRLAAGEDGILADRRIDASEVRELLGRPKVHPERAAEQNEVGIATGMYYTPVGGDIMFVEASIRRREQPMATDDGETPSRPGSAPISLILTA